ncbi:MAG: hypothetical protein ACP5IL_15190 [Syntrophobacteraceae bacterium]
MNLSISNRRSAALRYLSLSLALFIFVLTSCVELTHDKDDYECGFSGHTPLHWSAPTPLEPRHVCLACLVIQAFQAARVIWFFLLLLVMAVSHCRRSYEPKFHSSFLFEVCRIRAPPFYASDFSSF